MIPNDSIAKLSDMASDLADAWITFEDEPEPDLISADSSYLTEALVEFGNLVRDLNKSDGESFAPDLIRIAIQELIPEVKLLACAALREVGQEIIPHTIKMLSYRQRWKGQSKHDRELDTQIRLVAAATCGLIGEKARPTVPHLLKRLRRERDDEVRAIVVWSLGQIAPTARVVRNALTVVASTDPDDGVRWQANAALADVTPAVAVCPIRFEWRRPSLN
jgi:HEAT repeat protein